MLPISLMLSLAQGRGKVLQTFKPQTSLEGKVADREAGCISYRRQLWRTELKKGIFKMARSQPHRGRRDGKAVKESKVKKKAQDKKSCQLISSAQERGLSTAPGLTHPCASAVWGGRTTVSAAGIFLIPLQIGSGSWVSKKLLDFLNIYFFFQLSNFSFVSINFLVSSLNCLTIRQTLCWGKASAWLELCLFQLWLRPA